VHEIGRRLIPRFTVAEKISEIKSSIERYCEELARIQSKEEELDVNDSTTEAMMSTRKYNIRKAAGFRLSTGNWTTGYRSIYSNQPI
jgi:hypothetical protein